MEIIEELINSLEKRRINEVYLGFYSTIVSSISENGDIRYGIASTLRDQNCLGEIKLAGKMKNLKVEELASLMLKGKGPEISIGMATINSALPKEENKEINAKEIIIKKGKGKNIAIIGHFPFTDEIKKVAKELKVSELIPKSKTDISPEEMEIFLPQADVLALSALTLMNKTFERIISLCKKDCIKILLGPSAPVSKKMLKYVDVVSGTEIINKEDIILGVNQGISFKDLKGKKLISIAKNGVL